MPGKDGKGPLQGGGRGKAGSGRGSGRAGGQCLCPQCGAVAPHSQGTPCMNMKCPKCGAAMVRE